jgi:hypothetical protein
VSSGVRLRSAGHHGPDRSARLRAGGCAPQ